MPIQVALIVYVLFLVLSFVFVEGKENQKVKVYTFATFPQNEVALHMPCQESNMFATKCMCHIRCTSPKCDNAIRLCEKYSERFVIYLSILLYLLSCYNSKGCRYVFMRGGANNKFATLKRVPTQEEFSRLVITIFSFLSRKLCFVVSTYLIMLTILHPFGPIPDGNLCNLPYYQVKPKKIGKTSNLWFPLWAKKVKT